MTTIQTTRNTHPHANKGIEPEPIQYKERAAVFLISSFACACLVTSASMFSRVYAEDCKDGFFSSGLCPLLGVLKVVTYLSALGPAAVALASLLPNKAQPAPTSPKPAM